MTTSPQHVRLDTDGDVAMTTLDRPEARTAYSEAELRQRSIDGIQPVPRRATYPGIAQNLPDHPLALAP